MIMRIAAIVAIVAAIGSLYFTHRLANTKSAQKNEIERLDSSLKSTTAKLQTSEKNLEQTSAALAETRAALEKAEADLRATAVTLDMVTKQVAALKDQLAERTEKLTQTEEKMAAMEADFTRIQRAMKDAGIEAIGNIEQIRSRLEAQSEENKLLAAQLAKMRDENASLQKRIEELTTVPVGLRSRVELVDDRWNFVVLDVGRNQRVQPNTQFLLYRDSKMIGKAQVVAVGDCASVAELLPEYQRATPQPGDLAVR